MQAPASTGAAAVAVQVPWVVSDSTRKLFVFAERIGIATWGAAHIGQLPTGHYINEFLLQNQGNTQLSPEAFAQDFLAHFTNLAPGLALSFMVVGYDGTDPFVLVVDVSKNTISRVNWDSNSKAVIYGAQWAGDADIVTRLVGNAPIAWQLMNLQDAVDLTRHLTRTTIDQMRFEARVPTVGGPIDTLTSTPVRTKFLIRKELHP
jgi:hypothetical protein